MLLGSNVSQVGGYATAFACAREWACDCIQLHLTPSRTWIVPELLPGDIETFKALKARSGVAEIVSHVPFIVNMASRDPGILRRSIQRLRQEVQIAEAMGVMNIVMHPGSYQAPSKAAGLSRLVSSIDEALEGLQGMKSRVCLETMAGQGTMLCSTFEDFKYIFDNLQRASNVGACFDTAHVFEAGHDLRGKAGYERVMNDFDKIAGIATIGAIHLNDSATILGSRNDRHACVGEGKMGLQAFHALLNDARFDTVPMILEIPERDEQSARSLAFLRDLKGKDTIIEKKIAGQQSLF